jgi:UDP-N-acetylmuramyl pentapeptide phosphotransferase/UDP-N-acetylglucosamine-1-phosphate transferase
MLLGVPIFDASLVVLSRLRRRKPVYSASRDHTYHRLLQFGWSSNRAVLAMQIAALVLGCLAFLALARSPLIANLIFAGSVLAGILGIVLLDRRRQWS